MNTYWIQGTVEDTVEVPGLTGEPQEYQQGVEKQGAGKGQLCVFQLFTGVMGQQRQGAAWQQQNSAHTPGIPEKGAVELPHSRKMFRMDT